MTDTPHEATASREMQGKVALVTGATSGIGRATARLFAQHGGRVVVLARDASRLAALVDEISSHNYLADFIVADVTDEHACINAVNETVRRYEKIDCLINAAGRISNGSVRETTLAAWDEMLNINTRAVFHLMQLAAPHLEKTRGSIVNVSSVTGLRAFPGVLAYCVSKAAVDQLTRCAALELAPVGVRVNAVNPGVVVTELHKRGGMSDKDYETFLERSATTHPLGRAGTPEEVAELIYYLASPRAAWITGVTYEIDGGRAQTCAR